jgi:hypothetical protein
MTGTTLTVGMKVRVDDDKFAGIWTVTKVNPKTVRLTRDQGGRPLVAPHDYVAPVTDEEAAQAARVTEHGAGVSSLPIPTRPDFHPGTLVTLRCKPGYFVVLADKGTRINVAALGGDDGRYWRTSPAMLTVVDPAAVLQPGDRS